MQIKIKSVFLIVFICQTSVSGIKSSMWRLLLQNRANFKTPEHCDHKCADSLPFVLCLLANTFGVCAWPWYERNCQFSCKVCKACEKPTPECIFDSCTNDMILCTTYKAVGMCPMKNMKEKCKRSCGQCGPRCKFPPLPGPCTNDCRDEVASIDCDGYKTRGYCASEEWMAVRQKCKLTCGLCSRCDAKIGERLNTTVTTIETTTDSNTTEVSSPDPRP